MALEISLRATARGFESHPLRQTKKPLLSAKAKEVFYCCPRLQNAICKCIMKYKLCLLYCKTICGGAYEKEQLTYHVDPLAVGIFCHRMVLGPSVQPPVFIRFSDLHYSADLFRCFVGDEH